MGKVTVMAGERRGYALSGRGSSPTSKEKTDQQISVEGDQRLFYPYAAIMVNPKKHAHV